MDYILQLGLNKLRKSDLKDPAVRAVWLIDQVLEVVVENLSEVDSEGNTFRSQLESVRREILESGKAGVPGITALTTLDLCRGQFKKSQSKRQERDAHLAEIIVFLRKALANLTGESQTFHDDLLGTTDRIQELIKIEDIRELRLRVTEEVQQLRSAVAEKQKRDRIQINQLSEQISVLQHKLEVAKAEASIDGLTGVANRRNFDYTIQRWVIGHEKSEEPFTVAIFDIDNFKRINDTYGHQVGDQVLIETAAILSKNIRGGDFLARYGGEEFVVLAAGMKLAESERRFAEMLKQIEARQFDCHRTDDGTEFVAVTASCGIAEYALGESARDLISRADEAMYEAKRAGKNRTAAKRRPLLSAFYEGRRRNSIA